MKRHFNKIPSNDATVTAEMLVLRSLLIIKELLTHHLLIMMVIAEIGPTAHLITSVSHQVFYIKAIVSTTNKPDKKYFGMYETPFKDRYRNHTRDFRHKKYVNSTELSKYFWKLKEEGETLSVTWNIMSVVNYRLGGCACRLCLTEK